MIEPVPDAPAATADLGGERALVVADYHAGIEVALRYDGVEVDSRADDRRERLLDLVGRTGAERVVVCGDLAHDIGRPAGEERAELAALLEALPVPLTLVRGNHDGEIDEAVDIDVTDGEGVLLGEVGFAHGHTWPGEAALSGDTLCVGHEHPAVRIEDSVGGSRVERVWLRGGLDAAAFAGPVEADELVVLPAFNDLSGGTWVNVPGQAFLSPFLPEGLTDGQAYLLDGTRLGAYGSV
jgi:putative SbcD/Mre11-related phosphoesterase